MPCHLLFYLTISILSFFSCVGKVGIWQTQFLAKFKAQKKLNSPSELIFLFIPEGHAASPSRETCSGEIRRWECVHTPSGRDCSLSSFLLGTAWGVIFKGWKNSDINYICESILTDWLYSTLCSWRVAQGLGVFPLKFLLHFGASEFPFLTIC